MLIGVPPAVAAQDLVSQTIKTCADATSLGTKLTTDLDDVGWKVATPSEADLFTTVFADGVAAAMSGDRITRIDWSQALPKAEQFSAAIFNASLTEHSITALLSDENGKAALVLIDDPETPDAFRYLYSGPSDAELRNTLNLISQTDNRVGLKQATPEIQIALIDTMTRTRRTSTRIARFMRSMDSVWGREAHVGLGFSLINAPTS